MTAQSDLTRVVMLWPSDLKREIQSEVGKRGLTQYVLQAIREKRGLEVPRTADPAPVPTQVVVEQRLLDGVAPPIAHTGPTCSTCKSPLEPDGSCWVCG
jgi:hypothetical protein